MGHNNAVQSAQDLMNAINNAILSENHRDGDYHGITIFLPDDTKWYNGIAPWDSTHTHKIKEYYVSLDFSETQWDEFLNALYVG